MAASSIWRRATPRRGAISFTVIRMAEKRSALGDTAFHSRNCGRRRVAWNDLFALRGLRADGIAADLTALGALGKGIGSIDVAAPVPDIAAHVVKPVAVRGKGTDRLSSCESVRGVTAVWKSPVQRFSMKRPHGRLAASNTPQVPILPPWEGASRPTHHRHSDPPKRCGPQDDFHYPQCCCRGFRDAITRHHADISRKSGRPLVS